MVGFCIFQVNIFFSFNIIWRLFFSLINWNLFIPISFKCGCESIDVIDFFKGRFPIHYQIIKQMIGYWHHLENLESSFPLLKAAYNQGIICFIIPWYNSSKKLFVLKNSWYGSIHYIKEKIPGLEKYLSYNSSTFKQHCKKIIKDRYILWWKKKCKCILEW